MTVRFWRRLWCILRRRHWRKFGTEPVRGMCVDCGAPPPARWPHI